MSDSSPVRAVGVLDELRRFVPTEQIAPQATEGAAGGGSFAVEPATRAELVDREGRGACVLLQCLLVDRLERCAPGSTGRCPGRSTTTAQWSRPVLRVAASLNS